MNRYLQKIASRSGMTNTGSMVAPQVLPQRPASIVDTPTSIPNEVSPELTSKEPVYPEQTPVNYSSLKNENTPDVHEPKSPLAIDNSTLATPYQAKPEKELVTPFLFVGNEEARRVVQLSPVSIKKDEIPVPVNTVDAIKETPQTNFIRPESEDKIHVVKELINSSIRTEKSNYQSDTILLPAGISDSNPIAEKKTPQKSSLFIGHLSVEIIKPENPVKQIRERSVKKHPAITTRPAHANSLSKLGFGLGQT